jgi:hypothetical protein
MGSWLIWGIFKEEVQMASKYMKKCSPSLVIREIQIKTTLKLYLIPIRVSIMKGKNNNCWQGCGKTGTLHTAGGNAS